MMALHKRGVRVILTSAHAELEAKLRKTGLLNLLGEENLFLEFSEALRVTCSI